MKKRIALHEADPSRSPLAVFARLHTHWTDRQAVDDERKLVQAIESIKVRYAAYSRVVDVEILIFAVSILGDGLSPGCRPAQWLV